jgi:cardiolipin synthase (CMP-forming)
LEARAGGAVAIMSKTVGSNLFRNLPNLITVGRLVLVPAVVAAIDMRYWTLAFVGFLVAGVSDGVDGWLAKRFSLRTELGAYLDPLADKALLVSIWAALAWVGTAPVSLVVFIVFRDVMIVGAVIVSWVMDQPVAIRPLLVSKATTALQITVAAAALAAKSFAVPLGTWFTVCGYAVAALTVASLAAYLSQWLKHMSG